METLEAKYVETVFSLILLEFNLSNRAMFSTIVNCFISCFRFPNLQFEYKDPEAGFNRSKVSFCSTLIES